MKKWNHDAWMSGETNKKRKNDGESNESLGNKSGDVMRSDETPKSLRERYGNYSKKRHERSEDGSTPKPEKRQKTETPKNKDKEHKSKGNSTSSKKNIIPFDYSSTQSVNLLDPSLASAQKNNPFFSGAALDLGSRSGLLSKGQNTKVKDKKRTEECTVKNKKREKPQRRDPNKMLIYKR